MILDPDDPVWTKYLTAEELHKIKLNGVKSLEKLLNEVEENLDSFDREWATGRTAYSLC